MNNEVLSTSTESRTLTAFFDTRADADEAVARLVADGIARTSINIVEGGSRSTTTTSTYTTTGEELGFWDSLKDLFLPEEDRATYAEGLRRGGFVVTVRTDGAHYDRALDILDDEGTIDIDERAAAWRSEGWTGYTASPAHATGLAGATTSATSLSGSAAPVTHASTTATAESLVDGREEVIPVTEEQLRIGKREVSHGRVRVRSYVVETPVQEQVGLHEERVFLERRPVDRALTGAETLFEDRVIEAEETAQEAVVSKEARVKEEIVLRKDATDRIETINDSVRRTEVEVEDGRTASLGTTTERKLG